MDRKSNSYPLGRTLQTLLPSVFKTIEKGKRNKLSKIKAVWPSVVSEKYAKMSSPLRFENGILYIKVSSAPLMQNLNQQKAFIMTELKSKVVGLKMHNIIFKR